MDAANANQGQRAGDQFSLDDRYREWLLARRDGRQRQAQDLCAAGLAGHRQMLATEQDESTYRVRYSSYVIPLIFLCLVPLMLIEHGSSLLDGSIETGELIGLSIGVLLPLTMAYFFIEFASFTFSVEDGLFSWRWRNLISSKNGEVPLSRIVTVRRDALESGDSGGLKYSYRLLVVLNDNTMIPLTRGYSGLYDKKLDQIVDQIREHIRHSAAMT
jgi:hypothetical protein